MSQTTMDITFRKVVPEANVHRFYRVIVTRNLLGESVCVSQWGRIGTCGQRREKAYDSATDAQLAGATSVLERLKRGYTVAPGLSFIDKNIEQAAALDYLCTLHRSTKVSAARRMVSRSPVRRGPRINIRQMALWPEDKTPQHCAKQPAQDVPRPRDQRMTTGQVLQPPAGNLTVSPTLVTGRQSSRVAPASTPAAQHLVATSVRPQAALPTEPRSDAQNQARIECVLKASQRLATRSGASLKVTRADSLLPASASDLTAYQRELIIERATGVPRRGWPAHQRRAFR